MKVLLKGTTLRMIGAFICIFLTTRPSKYPHDRLFDAFLYLLSIYLVVRIALERHDRRTK